MSVYLPLNARLSWLGRHHRGLREFISAVTKKWELIKGPKCNQTLLLEVLLHKIGRKEMQREKAVADEVS